ncbi:hypothetical protein [Cellulomonas xylanilytica]|uniref:F5/8 type C domain-containing protein n=1 Tax=Cellulomonas xylanilytica TaxID=233583 RepID=A0A510V3C6_9CELL|nr:hypothetical protein [Cellulomonas xylanilytica]GEK19800.1 hypothetical protein CXY01_03200 [Cellulomonas xylanilytica]
MIVCARCHHENPDGTLLCETCRTYLGWSATAPAAAPAPALAPDADPPTDESPEPPAPPASAAPSPPPPPSARQPLLPTPPSVPGAPAVAPGAPRAPAPITVRAAGGPGSRAPITPVAVPAAPSGRPAPAVPPPVPAAPPAGRAVPVAPPPTSTAPPPGRAAPVVPPPGPAASTPGRPAPGVPPSAPAAATTHAATTAPDAAAAPDPAPPVRRPPTTVRPVPVVLTPSETSTRPPERTPAREAPERTIGVRVAAGEARIAPRAPTDPDHPTGTPAPPNAFDAVLPSDVGAYAGTADDRTAPPDQPAPADAWQSFEDATRCPACGRAIAVSRRFCRCGATLVRTATPDVDPEPPREPWYRRWLGGFRRGRGFWRRMRAANNGVRVRYDQARSAQVHLAEVTALLAALGITAVFVLPSTAQIEKQVVEQVTALDPRGYSTIDGVTATTDPATPPEPGFDPSFAVDGTTGRAWAGVWTPPTDAGPTCRRPGGTDALVLTLPGPTTVDRIAFSAGMPESSPDRATQELPHRVDVSWGDGADQCQTFDLTDSPDLQAFDLDATDVAQVRVVVVSVHETPDPPEVRHVAFNEVLLQQRGAPGLDVPAP